MLGRRTKGNVQVEDRSEVNKLREERRVAMKTGSLRDPRSEPTASQRQLRSQTKIITYDPRPLPLPREDVPESPPTCQADNAVPGPVKKDTSEIHSVRERKKPKKERWFTRDQIRKL